uniref:tRNA-guanine transglycosylase n=5 Tax=Gammaproteobacteria TaxID=1236 RepID=A0A0U2PYF0_ECOLX|nr:tRNA-guanine transglycosylase [Escherichia coli]
MMCLDYCTHPDDSYETNIFSVEVTIDWAKRCKREYERQLLMRKIPPEKRPLLFAIIQGGSFF